MNSEKDFDRLSPKKRANYIRDYYNQKDGQNIYATSPDFNLRELEIDFIINNVKGPRILDLGCGNGYTLLRLAEKIKGDLIGVDFSSEMIQGANQLLKKNRQKLKSQPKFFEGDGTTFSPLGGKIDTIISERFLLNLPNKRSQYETIENIHRLLRSRGFYLMIEGSKDGLRKLNKLRESVGLEPILDRDKHNLSSRKFNDNELFEFLKKYFTIMEVKTFDLYYLIGRLIYPKIIYPEKPHYNHPVNEIARKLTAQINFPSQGIGHVKGYVLRKK
ncbi:MAG: class I SAM-dependent methyltransferase [Patescibacteria group bacterium]|nr:class I SAM-dependent methyltransferase [Patescibacteria group bacterium]